VPGADASGPRKIMKRLLKLLQGDALCDYTSSKFEVGLVQKVWVGIDNKKQPRKPT